MCGYLIHEKQMMSHLPRIKICAVLVACSLSLRSSKAASNEYRTLSAEAQQTCFRTQIAIRQQLTTIEGIKLAFNLETLIGIEQHLEETLKVSAEPAHHNHACHGAYMQHSYVNGLNENRRELIELDKAVGDFLKELHECDCSVEDLKNKIKHL